MKYVMFTTAAALSLAIAGPALAERAHAEQQVQLAAGGGNHPQADTNEHGTQLAYRGGYHPQAGADRHAA